MSDNTINCDSSINKKEYILKDEKNNNQYELELSLISDKIYCKYQNYEKELTLHDISQLTKIFFNNINEAFEFISNKFINKKIKIISPKNDIDGYYLQFEIYDNISSSKKTINIPLYSKQLDKNDVIINNLKSEIKNLKIENQKLTSELNNLKSYFFKNPRNINLLTSFTKNIVVQYSLDNTFAVFNSINNVSYLIYAGEKHSIIAFNLTEFQIISEIKKAHREKITNFRHFFYEKDLLMSISSDDNNIKIWDVNSWNCILNLPSVNKLGKLYSACFINDFNNNLYILTSNRYLYSPIEPIFIFDLKGTKINEIKNSNEDAFFIDVFYDDEKNIYIITGNNGFVKSYNYNKNEIYKIYKDGENRYNDCVVVKKINNKVQLFESCESDSYIRIWDFHQCILLQKINLGIRDLVGICLWDEEYLFVCCKDRTLKLVDIKKGKLIKSIVGHGNGVVSVKKIVNEKLGECLISHGIDGIKIWTMNDENI